MTRHLSAAAPRRMSAADAMPNGRGLPAARMAAVPLPVNARQGPVPRMPWILLGLGVGVLIVAAVGAVVVSWAAGGFPIGPGGAR